MPVARGQAGVRQEMHKFKEGSLHSGSKHGPVVKNRKQAIAIAMHQAGLSKNPGSIANRDGSRPHGGFEMAKTGQRAVQPAPRGAAPAGRVPPLSGPRANASPSRNPSRLAASGAPATAMYGGPPAEGFHRVDSGVGPQGAAVKRQALNKSKFSHLGRFSTGKPKASVNRHTSIGAIANR